MSTADQRAATDPVGDGRGQDTVARTDRAPVLEVFRSFQGEGRYLGQPQVFVRLAGCPLRCLYCDTPHSWVVKPERAPRVGEADADTSRATALATPFEVALWIAEAEAGAMPHAVSVTGGEPLLWPEFLRGFAKLAGERRLHLETAGAHPRTLAALLGAFAHVSLDLKLPSDLAAPVEVDAAHHAGVTDEPAPVTAAQWTAARRASLDLLAGRDAAAKLVVTAATQEREAFEALEDLAEIAPDLPLFVQPATAMPRADAPALEAVRAISDYALELELDARVVPQMHRALGIR